MFHFSENATKNLRVVKWCIFLFYIIKHPTTQLRCRKASCNEDNRMETDKLEIRKQEQTTDTYVVGSKIFRPYIQKQRQMENGVRDI